MWNPYSCEDVVLLVEVAIGMFWLIFWCVQSCALQQKRVWKPGVHEIFTGICPLCVLSLVFSSLCRKMGSKGFHHQAATSLANDVDVDMRLIKKWPMNINRFKVQCFNTQSFIVSNKSFLPFLGVPSIESMLYPDKQCSFTRKSCSNPKTKLPREEPLVLRSGWCWGGNFVGGNPGYPGNFFGCKDRSLNEWISKMMVWKRWFLYVWYLYKLYQRFERSTSPY